MQEHHQRILDNLKKKDAQLAQRQALRGRLLLFHYLWMILGAAVASFALAMILALTASLGVTSILALTAAGGAAGAAIVLLNRGPAGGALVVSIICFPIVLYGLMHDAGPIYGLIHMIVIFTTLPGWPIAGVVLGLSHDAWDKGNGTV